MHPIDIYGSCNLVMDRITATAVIFFNNRVYSKKFVSKKKFILPILKIKL